MSSGTQPYLIALVDLEPAMHSRRRIHLHVNNKAPLIDLFWIWKQAHMPLLYLDLMLRVKDRLAAHKPLSVQVLLKTWALQKV